MTPEQVLFSGECQLAGWSETHTGGVKVVLWLADRDALDPFRAMTVRKGNVAGQILMVAMSEVGDDGQPVRQPQKPQRLSQVAAMFCDNPNFWEWLHHEHGYTVASPEDAATTMRELLGIESRAELDRDPGAVSRFHDEIRRPFLEWAH